MGVGVVEDAGKAEDNSASAVAVAAVLLADSHYAALSAPSSATRAELCHAYVETSVKVHPAGNHHPDAEQAFLRATAAWVELGNERTRRQYDEALQSSLAHTPPSVSSEDARVVFAHAWSECLSGEVGANMTEFAQVLSRAQELVQAQSEQPTASKSLAAAAGGLALSFGLWAAGTAASASGYAGVGTLAKNAALIQGASQLALGGLSAYKSPEVCKAVESATRPFHACASSAAEAGSGLGAIWGGLPSCLPRPAAAEEQADSECSSEELALRPEDEVSLIGLRAAAELNGRHGVIAGFDESAGRYKVQLLPGRELKLVKRENLVLVRELCHKPPQAVDQFI